MENIDVVKKDEPINILLVEDNPGDIRLAQEIFKDGKVQKELHVVEDGVEAMAFLKKEGKYADSPRPDLILLDLNLPRKDGREVLDELKSDESLRRIPVIILTTSKSEEDVIKTYNMHANCFITKPVDIVQFLDMAEAIEEFWFNIVSLPRE